jgi:hypothetical protein
MPIKLIARRTALVNSMIFGLKQKVPGIDFARATVIATAKVSELDDDLQIGARAGSANLNRSLSGVSA